MPVGLDFGRGQVKVRLCGDEQPSLGFVFGHQPLTCLDVTECDVGQVGSIDGGGNPRPVAQGAELPGIPRGRGIVTGAQPHVDKGLQASAGRLGQSALPG